MICMILKWAANPFRGDVFAEGWRPAAEAVLDYGATSWSFYRAHDGRLDFIQTATFPTKADFERYWYSEEIAEKRVELCRLLPGAAAAGLLGDRGRGQGPASPSSSPERNPQPRSSGAIVSP